MNLQEKVLEAARDLRSRAALLATDALKSARIRAGDTAKRVDMLKGSLATLTLASRELNKVARRHAARFVKENSTIAVAAGKEVSALARTTYASLSKHTPAKTVRKAAVRKRAKSRNAAA